MKWNEMQAPPKEFSAWIESLSSSPTPDNVRSQQQQLFLALTLSKRPRRSVSLGSLGPSRWDDSVKNQCKRTGGDRRLPPTFILLWVCVTTAQWTLWKKFQGKKAKKPLAKNNTRYFEKDAWILAACISVKSTENLFFSFRYCKPKGMGHGCYACAIERDLVP